MMLFDPVAFKSMVIPEVPPNASWSTTIEPTIVPEPEFPPKLPAVLKAAVGITGYARVSTSRHALMEIHCAKEQKLPAS